jgi:hypothetical protein
MTVTTSCASWLKKKLVKPPSKRLFEVASLLTDNEFNAMMAEFDQAGAWMKAQMKAQRGDVMSRREQHVIALERDNLAELDVIERWARHLGTDKFESEVKRLAALYAIDPEAPIQSINRQHHPSLIGMTDRPFHVLQQLCNQLIEREPLLLQRLSYRCSNEQHTALPWGLWLSLVRAAREAFDPAAYDMDFMLAKQQEGLSIAEALAALIAAKRNGVS